jgi:hypothetical protein
VKILPLILVAFGLMQTFAVASTNNPTIYISTRTDGLPGTGTAADPFNGSTETLFDALMKSIASNTTINLSAGTFLTNGADAFRLKSGWTINGSGMGVTIIKLAGHVDTAANKHYHFWGNSITNLEIANLTCDGNSQGYNWPAHQSIGGIFVNGCSNGLIDHVEMIHCYGDGVDQLEKFSIILSGLPDGTMGANCIIQNCVTHEYAPGANYTFGCGICYATNPRIINCRDDGSTHAFGFSGTTGAKITGCSTTSNTYTGFYSDILFNSDLTIENNIFKVTQIPIQFNSPAGNEENVKIVDNILESANPTGSGDAAIVLSGVSGNNFEITGNFYIYTGPQGDGLILNNQESFTDLDVEDNSSNVGLTGGGGGAHSVTDTASVLSGNHFNQSVADLNDEEQSSPANDVAATTGSLAPTNFGSSSSSEPASVASTPAPATTPTTTVTQASQPVSNAATSSSVAATQSLPAQAVTHVLKMNAGPARTVMLREVLAQWVVQNPPAAARYAQSMPSGPDRLLALDTVASQWALTNAAAATDWATSLPPDSDTQQVFHTMAAKWADQVSAANAD